MEEQRPGVVALLADRKENRTQKTSLSSGTVKSSGEQDRRGMGARGSGDAPGSRESGKVTPSKARHRSGL